MRQLALLMAAPMLALALMRQPAPTYSEDIAPILKAKCVNCHYPGGPGAFSIASYAEAKRHSPLVRYVSIIRSMPPTDAASEFGTLTQCPPLNDTDTDKLQRWVAMGMPEGTPIAPLTAPPADWSFKPSQVLMPIGAPPVRVEGGAYRATLTYDPGLAGTRRLVAFAVRPKQPKVLRQVLLARAGTGESPFSPLGADDSRLIGAAAMGCFDWHSSAGIPVAAGEKLLLSALLQPSGKAESGDIELALLWSDETGPRAEWSRIGVKDFTIPARWEQTRMQASTTLEADSLLSAIHPELRKYASELNVTAQLPGQPEKALLSIFTWDRTWIGAYNFREPVRLPKGTRITAKVLYNNSECAEPTKRQIPVPISYGPGDSDEVFWVHFLLSPAKP